MSVRPVLIGIDGGATKVSAWVIDRLSEGFNLGNAHSQKTYSDYPPFDPGFIPVKIQIQLQEMDSTIHLTELEQIQGKAILDAFVETITELNTGKPMIIGIGMPGLKTPDGRGIAVMANGPRMPHFSDNLENALGSKNIQLAAPVHRLGSDADYCGYGEEYAADGLFKSVENGYYLGGGTGAADALKLQGKLVPLDKATSWILKSWEMVNQEQISLEHFASAGGIQSIYSKYSEIPMDSLKADSIYADIILQRAIHREEPALKTYADVSLNLAELLFERIETIFSGWSGRFRFVTLNRKTLLSDHPFLGTVMDRIIIGQRLGSLLETSKGSGILWEPMIYQLGNLIQQSKRLDSKTKKTLLVNAHLNPNFIQISALRDAPALGAGVDAVLSYNKDKR